MGWVSPPSQCFAPLLPCAQELQELQAEKEGVEAQINHLAQEAAKDLGLTMDKTIK